MNNIGRQSWRVAQSYGAACIGVCDIPPDEMEGGIDNMPCAGCYIDGAQCDGRDLLRVYAFGGPEPGGQSTFAQRHLHDDIDFAGL